MEAIHLNERKIVARRHRYACGGIIVTPNPPQVGVETILAFYLKNPGPEPLTVTRLEAKVSQFGMGASWEELPVIGPIELPGDPGHIEEVTMRWTPRTGGHRCVRANIFVEQEPQPFLAGCNLTIIESEAHKRQWDIPFRLGNPEPVRMPIVLDVHGTEEVRQYVIVNGRVVRAGQPIWLEAGEEVDARLMLHAQTLEALESVNRIEAMIGDRFLDGIEVILRRPAWQGTGPSWSADSTPRPFAHRERQVESVEELATLRRI